MAPGELFDQKTLQPLLRWNDPKQSTYYKAILQNLFFATLNTEMGAGRCFRSRNPAGQDAHYGIPTFYRYESLFTDPAAALGLFADIPFLNGGLFECLDRPAQGVRVDGFSDRGDNPLAVPDALFFAEPREVDLNAVFDTRNKKYPVRGLLRIFDSYKFTIEENTPIEEEIALDPELLGKVFENLLAAYNPETGASARKQTGSFYTPRPIVEYMVDESLLAYLETALAQDQKSQKPGFFEKPGFSEEPDFPDRLRHLLAYNQEAHQFGPAEVETLIAAIDRVRILDPACGSGAFPMGVLHKLVFLLGKLDPGNVRWQARQVDKAAEIPDSASREAAIASIEQVFSHNFNDYGRKLYLIENCIYGVDIQPIAVQIAKLRFFISLVVDQRLDDARPNRGVRPLPNLETKFVAANTLIGIARPQQMALRDPAVERKERELAEVRRRHFAARTQATKEKYRGEDKRLRGELAALLRQDGWGSQTAGQLAAWDPYDQNAHADFFDPEWMFGVTEGFDIVIGNPPYVRQEQLGALKPLLQKQYACYTGTADLYVYFFERGLRLLAGGGVLTYISSNKYFRAGYGEKLRGYLAGQMCIEQLIDFGDAPVFTAIAYPSIILARRRAPGDGQTRALTWQAGAALDNFADTFRASSFLIAQRELTPDGWRLEMPSVLRLMEKTAPGG
ncbi:Eco57I restriction-modification methylase domain-containing protein [Candidatus Amarolinea dominans]|uniref:Eco57I restriction-modification methylase domain-containing protein n=1 Tax=Candidatus Amarolinea dominans TaxID=3140696 RepID=UPI0031CCA2C1